MISNQVLELSDDRLEEINHLISLKQNRLLKAYWNRRNRRHRAGHKNIQLGASKMRLMPAHVKNINKTHNSSFWNVVVTKKNGQRKLIADFDHNVWPSVTIDYIHNGMFVDTSASKRGFGCIAVTADTTQTLNASVTALTGEITTNGLARVEAGTKTHTAASNSTLVEHTFTLSGSQSDITRSALFNVATAPVSGTIGPVAAFSNGATGAMVSGETVKVSITINTS